MRTFLLHLEPQCWRRQRLQRICPERHRQLCPFHQLSVGPIFTSAFMPAILEAAGTVTSLSTLAPAPSWFLTRPIEQSMLTAGSQAPRSGSTIS